ncbi:hypothetical protein LSG23_20290 (plasmid) [Bacillus velezensis]|uniref:hypothetical protein n=1 Tax=Bacillus velezensis TaxID=492670 RepID=UPI000987E98A|nr:hypothetical protein [Bacillus velezensis]AQS42452.1 hypothetical protein BVH55_00200 [Bacillus velezensis]WNR83254.1 hypothetical protein RP314_20560 [Bacillus velezensis]
MIKVYTIGHRIPEKIKTCIVEWNHWFWIAVANNPRKNRDAKFLIDQIQPDADKKKVYQTEDGIHIYVSYTMPVKTEE